MLLKIFFYKKKIDQTVEYLENFKPDIVFSVDSPDFVFQVIKKIKKEKKFKQNFFILLLHQFGLGEKVEVIVYEN